MLSRIHRRKSDIENERLPPDLVDPEEGKTYASSLASTPSVEIPSPPLTNGVSTNGSQPTTPRSPTSPSSPSSPSPFNTPFKRSHGRQASLGTTMTSPSTRRRSIESTMSLIKEAVDGEGQEGGEYERLSDQISGTKNTTASTNGIGTSAPT